MLNTDELLEFLRNHRQTLKSDFRIVKLGLIGSFARGEQTEDSDIDLFVLSNQPESAQRIIQKSSLSEKIQPVIKKQVEFIGLDKKKPLFYQEIEKGIILWEAK